MKPKKEVPHYIQAAGVMIRRRKVLLAQRPSSGLLGGMWEFPNGRVTGDPAQGLAGALKTGYKLRLEMTGSGRVRNNESIGVVQHAYTHFKVTVYVFRCELVSMPQEPNLKWIPLKDLDDYPMGKIDRQIAKMITK